jgi:hypothetical protein
MYTWQYEITLLQKKRGYEDVHLIFVEIELILFNIITRLLRMEPLSRGATVSLRSEFYCVSVWNFPRTRVN